MNTTITSFTLLDLKTVKNLVRQGEGLHIEFKLKTNHPEKIVREIAAFANTEGGKLFIGVSDSKELIGLKYSDEDDFLLSRAIERNISPEIDYDLHRVRLDNGKEILVYDVKSSTNKPHYVKVDEQTSKVYVRVKDRSIQASKEVREILKGEKKNRNIKFHFGDKERLLMQHLHTFEKITLAQFSEIANIPPRVASRTLVLLTLANVLKIQPNEESDFYSMAEPDAN